MNNINKFANELKNDKIFKFYNGLALFSILIFFVLNFEVFTFEEILIFTFIIIVLFKSISNIMMFLIIYFNKVEFKSKTDYYEELLNKREKEKY